MDVLQKEGKTFAETLIHLASYTASEAGCGNLLHCLIVGPRLLRDDD
jgi:hypothetical protein